MAKTLKDTFIKETLKEEVNLDPVTTDPENITGHSNPEVKDATAPPDWLTNPTSASELKDMIRTLIDDDDTNFEEEQLLQLIMDLVDGMPWPPKMIAYIMQQIIYILVPEDEGVHESLVVEEDLLEEGDELYEFVLTDQEILDELTKRIRKGVKQTIKKGYRKVKGIYQKIKRSTQLAMKRGARKRRHKKRKASVVAKAKRSLKKTFRKFGAFLKRNKGKASGQKKK